MKEELKKILRSKFDPILEIGVSASPDWINVELGVGWSRMRFEFRRFCLSWWWSVDGISFGRCGFQVSAENIAGNIVDVVRRWDSTPSRVRVCCTEIPASDLAREFVRGSCYLLPLRVQMELKRLRGMEAVQWFDNPDEALWGKIKRSGVLR